MPRIPEVPARQAGWLTRQLYRFARRRYGAVPRPVSIVAHHRKLTMLTGMVELGLERAATELPVSLRELATYRVATTIGCSWCVDFGTMLQLKDGLDIDRLKEIGDYRESPRFTEVERLVIDYADAMTELPTRVTDEQVAELDRRLGHRGLLELTYLIAVENQRSRLNHALGITAQGFTSGEACRVPLP